MTKQDITPFELLAASEQLPGITPFFKFGFNPDIDPPTLPEDIISLGGTKLFPTTASTLSIVSTSANDTAGGTGIQEVTIRGIDVNYNIIEESIALNGLTPVVTANQYLDTARMFGSLGGSLQFADGDIVATHAEGAITSIRAGEGENLDAAFTVPANNMLYIERISVGVDRDDQGASASGQFQINVLGENVWRTLATASASGQGSNLSTWQTFTRFLIEEKTQVKIRVNFVNNATTLVSGAFAGYLIDMDKFVW